MEKFELNILGCGSALPTTRHFLSAQVVCFQKKLYMIDCGEGSQLQFRTMKLKFQRLDHIFISHLHGDHCFGLPGLISTLGLLGRTADLHIYAQTDAEFIFTPFLRFFCKELPFQTIFHSFDPTENEVIFEDKTLKVSTIPLKHRIPTVGFLLEEKLKKLHIIREMVHFYRIPLHKIKDIENGADFITSDGEIIPNICLMEPAKEIYRKYAYCSDTAFHDKIIPLIEGVDLLYHESTFSHRDLIRAEETYHSSAKQAAYIAKAAHVKKLILGHFSARYSDETVLLKEAQEVFMNVMLANDQMVLAI